MTRVALTLAFDGTRYCGWQAQKNGLSVQTAVCEAAAKVYGALVPVTGCSRTDAGVHACGFVCHMDVPFVIPPDALPLALNRALPPDRAPKERLNDWNEIHGLLPQEEERQQAARCMSCSVPFCHSGLMIGGLPSGCPLNNLIPEWNDLLSRGEWEAAAQRLLMTNSFPEFTGRVCPAPCEGACTCGIHQPQVTIRQNELSIIENAFASGHMQPHPPATRTGKRVAVVGSGPSGLACANRLNHYGHSVTVLERSDRVGGLLTYGIPNMKLDKRIIARRVDFMRAEGVVFRTGCHVGVDLPAEALLHEFDAVVLCIGSGTPRDLDVPGRKGPGVAFALDYLTAATRAVLDGPETLPDALNAKG